MNVCGIDVSKDTLDIVVRKKGESLKMVSVSPIPPTNPHRSS